MGCLDASRTRGRRHHRGRLTVAGGAAAPTPGPASPGAQGHTPFFYQNSGVAIRRKDPSAEETGTAQRGAETQKDRPGFQGGAQAKSTAEARADVDGADGESLREQFK